MVGISHAAAIAPLLSHPHRRSLILEAAVLLAADTRSRKEGGAPPISPAAVTSTLVRAAREKAKPERGAEQRFLDEAGKLLLKVRKAGRAGLLFTVPAAKVGDRQAVTEAIDRYLRDLAGDR